MSSIIQLKRDTDIEKMLKLFSNEIIPLNKDDKEIINTMIFMIPKSEDVNSMSVDDIWNKTIIINRINNGKDHIVIYAHKPDFKKLKVNHKYLLIENPLFKHALDETKEFFEVLNYQELLTFNATLKKYKCISKQGVHIYIDIINSGYGLYLKIRSKNKPRDYTIFDFMYEHPVVGLHSKFIQYDNKVLEFTSNKDFEMFLIKAKLGRFHIKEKYEQYTIIREDEEN